MQVIEIMHPRLLHETLVLSATTSPESAAIVADGKEYTYRELIDSSSRLASALLERGLVRGDRVAVFMENSWEAIVSIYGILLAGGTFVVLSSQTKSDKLVYMLNDSGCFYLLTTRSLQKAYRDVPSRTSELKGILCASLSSEQENMGAFESFERVIAASAPLCATSSAIPLDLAAIIYTSGSTGVPKGVMMTHQAMCFTLGSLVEYLRLRPNDRILCPLPIAFDYGLYQILMAVSLGACVILDRLFAYPAKMLEIIQRQKVTVFPGVPTIFATLVAMNRRSPIRLPSVERVTNTAAALPAWHTAQLQKIFPNALVFKMYGLTECKRVCYLEPELLNEKGNSVGKAIPGTEVFLRSESGLEDAPPGTPGILYVRGPHVMLGYWNKPEESRKMLREGKYPGERILCTHDWFVQDDEGFLYFQGRSDDIIKTRGEKVSPLEIENVLCSINGVREAAVVGVDDELLGQSIRAFVVREEAFRLSFADVKRECMQKLESFMVPQEVVFVSGLPKTSSGKVRKKGLA